MGVAPLVNSNNRPSKNRFLVVHWAIAWEGYVKIAQNLNHMTCQFLPVLVSAQTIVHCPLLLLLLSSFLFLGVVVVLQPRPIILSWDPEAALLVEVAVVQVVEVAVAPGM